VLTGPQLQARNRIILALMERLEAETVGALDRKVSELAGVSAAMCYAVRTGKSSFSAEKLKTLTQKLGKKAEGLDLSVLAKFDDGRQAGGPRRPGGSRQSASAPKPRPASSGSAAHPNQEFEVKSVTLIVDGHTLRLPDGDALHVTFQLEDGALTLTIHCSR